MLCHGFRREHSSGGEKQLPLWVHNGFITLLICLPRSHACTCLHRPHSWDCSPHLHVSRNTLHAGGGSLPPACLPAAIPGHHCMVAADHPHHLPTGSRTVDMGACAACHCWTGRVRAVPASSFGFCLPTTLLPAVPRTAPLLPPLRLERQPLHPMQLDMWFCWWFGQQQADMAKHGGSLAALT